MTRVAELPPDTLSPEQKRIHGEIAGPRGGVVRGPFAIWLRIPELADAANRLGNFLRGKTRVEKRLFELMVLVVARHWSANYEWHVHEQAARSAGIEDATIEAIRAGRRPALTREDDRIVYDTITELNESRSLSPAAYERARAALGLERLVELVAAAGFYTMVAMTLDAFDVDVPAGGRGLS